MQITATEILVSPLTRKLQPLLIELDFHILIPKPVTNADEGQLHVFALFCTVEAGL